MLDLAPPTGIKCCPVMSKQGEPEGAWTDIGLAMESKTTAAN
jgi:hypothetical protein